MHKETPPQTLVFQAFHLPVPMLEWGRILAEELTHVFQKRKDLGWAEEAQGIYLLTLPTYAISGNPHRNIDVGHKCLLLAQESFKNQDISVLACEPKGHWFDFQVRAHAWVEG